MNEETINALSITFISAYLLITLLLFLRGFETNSEFKKHGIKNTLTYKELILFILFPTYLVQVIFMYFFTGENGFLNKKVFKQEKKDILK